MQHCQSHYFSNIPCIWINEYFFPCLMVQCERKSLLSWKGFHKKQFHGFQPWMTSEISINTYCTLSNSRKLNITQQHSVLSVQAPPSRMYSWLIIVPKRSSDITEENISNFDGYIMNPRSFHVLRTCFLDVKFQFALCIIKHGLGVILLLLTTVNMQDLIFSLWRLWTGYQCVTLCSLLCTYRCFRGTCCLLPSRFRNKAACSCQMSVRIYSATMQWILEGSNLQLKYQLYN